MLQSILSQVAWLSLSQQLPMRSNLLFWPFLTFSGHFSLSSFKKEKIHASQWEGSTCSDLMTSVQCRMFTSSLPVLFQNKLLYLIGICLFLLQQGGRKWGGFNFRMWGWGGERPFGRHSLLLECREPGQLSTVYVDSLGWGSFPALGDARIKWGAFHMEGIQPIPCFPSCPEDSEKEAKPWTFKLAHHFLPLPTPPPFQSLLWLTVTLLSTNILLIWEV